MTVLGRARNQTQDPSRASQVVVRAQSHVDTVRRRLQAIAQRHDATPPTTLNATDTVLLLTGPEHELRAWRCALALREQVLGEADIRIICTQVSPREERISGTVQAMLQRVPWNFVYALPPLADRLQLDEEDAALWALREPRVDALVYPASDIGEGLVSAFGEAALQELPRYAIRTRGDRPSEDASIVDEDGFLDVAKAAAAGAVPVLRSILSSRCALVVAPPWTGKSFVAKAASERLRRPGRFVNLTDLENRDYGGRYAPLDWSRWRASHLELIWLIDSVDEALHRGETLDVLGERLSSLESGERERLRVVLFARDDDTKERVTDFFANTLGRQLDLYRLLPVAREEAARSVRGHDRGVRTLESALARLRAAQLGKWATHIPMLIRAARAPSDARPEELQAQLLEALCTDSERRISSRQAHKELLEIAARAAAAMSLSAIQTLAEDQAAHAGVGALFQSSDDSRAFRALTQSGPLLLRTPEGFRFRQEHAKELLAAHALKGVRLHVLRRLMTDNDGRLRPDLSELARQIPFGEREKTEAVDSWRIAKPRPWAPEKAIRLLKDAERLAPRGRSGAWLPEQRLDHPETRKYLLERVQAPQTAAMARKLFLVAARQGGWREFVPAALVAARDDFAPPFLRSAAVGLLVALGGPAERAELEPLLRDGEAWSADARARLLLWDLERGEDPLRVAARMPVPERGSADYRTWLVSEIEERIRPEHARVVLDSLSNVTPEALTGERASLLLDKAVEVLLNQAQLAPDDIERIAAAVYAPDHRLWSKYHGPLTERLRTDADARRTRYLQLRGAPRGWEYPSLHAEDATWLLERLEKNEVPVESWKDLARFVYHSELPQPELNRATQYLEQRHTCEYAEWKVRATEEERMLAEQAIPRATETTRPRRQWLGDLVLSTLSAEEHPLRRIHELGMLCFGSTNVPSVDGTFDALAATLKQQTIAHAKRLLVLAEPTALPSQGGGYASGIRLEGDVFRAAVTWEDPANWLTGELIRRWLPSALFTSSAGQTETTWRCEMVDADATEAAAITALEAEARARDFPVFVRDVSCQLWERSELRRRSLALIRSGEPTTAYRSELLRKLARHCWAPAMRTLALELVTNGEKRMRIAAVSSLLQRDPERALAHLDESWSDAELADVLEPVSSWTQQRSQLDKWSAEDIERLLLVLAARGLPPEQRWGQIVSWGPVEHLRDVLLRLQERLHQIPDAAIFQRIVGRVETVNPELAAEMRSTDASYELMRLFEEPAFNPPSIRDVVDALDGTRSPRFRNADDFAETLLACLDVLRADSKEHIQLFSAGKKPHESLLQSYVVIRLGDLLARREPHNVVFTPREPNQGPAEPDLLAQAEGEGGSKLKIPIELKWSDSDEIFSGLEEQLAIDYVLRSRLTHGIYIVGFTGLGRHSDEAVLNNELTTRVARLQEAHPELRLDVKLLDLSPLNARKRRSKPRADTRSRKNSPVRRSVAEPARKRSPKGAATLVAASDRRKKGTGATPRKRTSSKQKQTKRDGMRKR